MSSHAPRAAWRTADCAYGLAYRMAGYIKDANYIARYVALEYGPAQAPSRKEVEAMQANHRASRERFKSVSETPTKDERETALRLAREQAKPASETPETVVDLAPPMNPAERVIHAVAYAFGLTPAALKSKRKMGRYVAARCVAAKLLHERRCEKGDKRTAFSAIGRILGGRDRSTIWHAVTVTFPVVAQYHPEAMAIYKRLGGRD